MPGTGGRYPTERSGGDTPRGDSQRIARVTASPWALLDPKREQGRKGLTKSSSYKREKGLATSGRSVLDDPNDLQALCLASLDRGPCRFPTGDDILDDRDNVTQSDRVGAARHAADRLRSGSSGLDLSDECPRDRRNRRGEARREPAIEVVLADPPRGEDELALLVGALGNEVRQIEVRSVDAPRSLPREQRLGQNQLRCLG